MKSTLSVIRDWEPSFLRNISDTVWSRANSNKVLSISRGHRESLVYTSADAIRFEDRGRLKRGLKDVRDAHTVSLGLRVVGDYLDIKGALAFDILWSVDLVMVKYDTHDSDRKEEHFTVQNLHDLGVGMYLRRSNRRAAG
jgi:hypothetical protein